MTDWAPLVDVCDMTLVDLLTVESGPIVEATRRIVADLEDPDGVCCGFSSAV